MTSLSSHLHYLEGCRFCPMCKPANEMLNVLHLESVSTRARALMLWNHCKSGVDYDQREIEILFQSTLDSISEAWCRSHYNVSGYIQAARADIVARGKVPAHIREWVQRPLPGIEPAGSRAALLLGEAGYLDSIPPSETAVELVKALHGDASVVRFPNGSIEYALGFTDRAREMLIDLQSALAEVDTVVVDGPSTWYALTKLSRQLEVPDAKDRRIVTLAEILAHGKASLKKDLLPQPAAKVLYHDGRSSFQLADSQVEARAIAPEFDLDNEEWLGSGRVFQTPRDLLRESGLDLQKSFWTRNLSRSSGADEGLFITYPDHASRLGKRLLADAADEGAEVMVTGSILDRVHLRGLEGETMPVFWLPELFSV